MTLRPRPSSTHPAHRSQSGIGIFAAALVCLAVSVTGCAFFSPFHAQANGAAIYGPEVGAEAHRVADSDLGESRRGLIACITRAGKLGSDRARGLNFVGDAEACVAECAPFAARSDAFGTVARRHLDACEMETHDAQALRSMASNLDQAKTLAEQSRFKEASKYLRAAEHPVKQTGASRTAKVRALQDACASLRARFSEPFAREDAYAADPQVRAWSAELRVLNDRFGALWHLHDKGNMAAERELESLGQRKSLLERELEARHRAMVDSP